MTVTVERHGEDGDFPLDVVSDYLPTQLLNRSWVGEFDT